MSRTRNDSHAVNARRIRALSRWLLNKSDNYNDRFSDPVYVDNQIQILKARVKP